LVNTVTANETITFKLWKPGSEVVTFINTLQSIPGGRTGTVQNMYAFNTNAVAGDDVVEPVFINELRTNYPNPFNPTTTIEFSLKENQNVSLEVFNIKGQKVKTLAKGMMEKGRHTIIWNGTNDHGQAVGSGIYFYKMDTKGYNKVRKALLLK
ncbi:MAG TPA: FlgD immunoglobulin-like domain containing protein, partial [Candidatus Cloacimonadota bacterium]|nr:FlgD immunoglobulin-like domain containing protein [Candidatus Cloacimonadota bacterium]